MLPAQGLKFAGILSELMRSGQFKMIVAYHLWMARSLCPRTAELH